MTRKAVNSPKLAPPVGPFSHAVEIDGLVFLSGQVGQDPETGKLVEGGIEAETERIFANIAAVLEATGNGISDVVRVGVFLTSMSDFAAMNRVYARHFAEPFPARSTVAVAELPLGANVEIDIVAMA